MKLACVYLPDFFIFDLLHVANHLYWELNLIKYCYPH